MTISTILIIAIYIAFTAAALVTLWRIVVGPSILDRAVASDVLLTEVVCVLGDPNEDLEAVDLENVVMVLVAPLLRRLVVELACDLATARGQDCPDWAVERTITTSALTTLEQAEAVFALLEQGE